MIIAKEKDLTSFSVKRSEDIPTIIAAELSLPEALVASVITGFHKDLKRTISEGEATEVKLRRFGTFKCTPYGVNKRIRLWLQAYRENKISREAACKKVSELWKLRVQFYE